MSSEGRRRVIRYASIIAVGGISAFVTNILIGFGDPAYRRVYPANQLCSTVKVGTELAEVQRRIGELGRPESISYQDSQLSVGDTQSTCIFSIDPSTSKVTKTTSSGPLIIF
jgi:hypothetical protein